VTSERVGRRLKGVRVTGWIAALVFGATLFLVPLPAWAVDRFYSRGLYPPLQDWMTALSNLLPFAAMDVLIPLAVLLVLYRATRLLIGVRERGVFPVLWEGTRRLVRVVALIGIVFMLAWGYNYRRVPLEAAISKDAAVSVDNLQHAVSDANRLAASLRPRVNAPGLAPGFEETATLLRDPMNRALSQIARGPLARPGRVKHSLILTPFFTWAGVDGMINPLVLESIVHPGLLPFERGHVIAHEWAHLAGQADEAEASAVGWLACMNGPPVLAYSASLYLIMEAGGALPRSAWRQTYPTLDAGVRADIEAVAERLRQQKPQVQQATSRVYDRYLRANRVADGTASYSRALELILAPPLRDRLTTYR